MSSDTFKITFLGTGTSVGVPVIGCSCPVCKSTNPHNKRTRSSILITTDELNILVDSGPDLREQALRENLTAIDAILYTHGHVDHVAGFDELRAFCWSKSTPLPLHASKGTYEILRSMFGWAFHKDNTYQGYVKPDPKIFSGKFSIHSLSITPLPVVHGTVETHGFLFETKSGKRIAYIPDVNQFPPQTLAQLKNLDLLILDALRDSPHPTHLTIAEATAISETLSPKKTLFTHISHDVEHSELSARFPANIQPAYDGLTIEL